MSNLSIGLITSPSEESQQLISMLEALDIQVLYHIAPEEINAQHIEDINLNVWLLNVDDDHWHDNIDLLLDESDASIYFNEPGTLNKQAHPEYWCSNLANRLYELTGISQGAVEEPAEAKITETRIEKSAVIEVSQQSKTILSPIDDESIDLSSALDELESSSIGLSSDVAAEIVSELESISPDLEVSLSEPKVTEVTEVTAVVEEPIIEELLIEESVANEGESTEVSLDEISEQDHRSFEQLVDIDFSGLDSIGDITDDGSQEQEVITLEDIELEELESDELETDNLKPESLDAVSLESAPLELDQLADLSNEDRDDSILAFNADDIAEQDELSFDIEQPLSEQQLSEQQLNDELDFSAELDFDNESFDNENNIDRKKEVADISDELLVLAGQTDVTEDVAGLDTLSIESNQSSDDDSIDEIDFSNFEMPVLESAREDDQTTLQSVYDIDENEQQEKTEGGINEAEAESLAVDEIPLLEDDGLSLDTELNLDSELSLDLEPSLDENIAENNPVAQSVSLETSFSLEEINPEEEQVIHGRASFIEEEPEDEGEEKIESNMDALDELAGLSLESVEEEQVSGKAVFIEETPSEDIVVEEENVTLDDGGLSLESVGDTQLTGKAAFVIDEALTDSEKQKEKSAAPIVRVNKVIEENDPSGLNLTPIDEQAESDWLNNADEEDDALVPELELPADEIEQTTEKEDFSFDSDLSLEPQDAPQQQMPYLEPSSELDAELETVTEPESDSITGSEAIESEPTEFEIPMLEEAAMDLDFAEVIPATQEKAYTPCWVIGASLGGPAAVKRFLQSLPAEINASFIVVQHIDENFLPVLADILTSNSNFEVKVANGSNPMTAGKIYLAPLKGKLIFLQDGSMLVDHSQKWSEPYSPCIDDVIDSLSAVYKAQSGAIIFSGMGQDGLKGAEAMLSRGGKVWAQSVDTCANSSMPEAIIKADFASVVAPPEMLADRLVEEMKQLLARAAS